MSLQYDFDEDDMLFGGDDMDVNDIVCGEGDMDIEHGIEEEVEPQDKGINVQQSDVIQSSQKMVVSNQLETNIGYYINERIIIYGVEQPYLIDSDNVTVSRSWEEQSDKGLFQYISDIFKNNKIVKETTDAIVAFNKRMSIGGFVDTYNSVNITANVFKNLIRQSTLPLNDVDILCKILDNVNSYFSLINLKDNPRIFYSTVYIYMKVRLCPEHVRAVMIRSRILHGLGIAYMNDGRLTTLTSLVDPRNQLERDLIKSHDMNVLRKDLPLVDKIIENDPTMTQMDTEDKYDYLDRKRKLDSSYMMIVAKYFQSNKDYINVMKVNSKYKNITNNFKYNPIPDVSIFPNIQTRYLYSRNEQYDYDNLNIYKYVLWYEIGGTEYNNLLARINRDHQDLVNRLHAKNGNKRLEYPMYEDDINIDAKKQISSDYSYNRTTDQNNITRVTYDDNVTYVKKVKDNMNDVDEVVLGKNIVKLGESAFNDWMYLKKVTMNFSATEIPSYCFQNTSIMDIIIPEGVTSIGSYAFNFCTNVTRLSLPNTLKSIGQCAFTRIAVKTITVPSSVAYIDNNAFSCCSNLTSVIFNDANDPIAIGEDVFFLNDSLTIIDFGQRPVIIKSKSLYNISNSMALRVHVNTFITEGMSNVNVAIKYPDKDTVICNILSEEFAIGYRQFNGRHKTLSITIIYEVWNGEKLVSMAKDAE